MANYSKKSHKNDVVLQLNKIMASQKREGVTKTEICQRMKTSPAQLDRILDESNYNQTLGSLQAFAEATGRVLVVKFTRPRA